MKLNDNILENFINTFYGSGNYKGDYWFVGMEECGGNYLERVLKRLENWEKLDRRARRAFLRAKLCLALRQAEQYQSAKSLFWGSVLC